MSATDGEFGIKNLTDKATYERLAKDVAAVKNDISALTDQITDALNSFAGSATKQAWRGYKIAWHAKHQPNRITLVASHGTSPMATISIGFDSPDGLLIDDLYRAEVDALRNAGGRICEFTKLAVDGAIRSKRVLATLFHIAYIYSHRMNGFSDLFIEVNPRHVRFYEQMLGFKQFGPERLNSRVNAPAVLLRLDFSHSAAQITKFGGQADLARVEKSLYPYFFSEAEERGIMGRLNKLR